MDILLYIVLLAVSGLFVGALARLALPGKDPIGIPMTIAVGLAGSFLAGLVSALIFGRNVGGIVLSVLFATAFVYLIRRRGGGTFTRAAGDPRIQDRR